MRSGRFVEIPCTADAVDDVVTLIKKKHTAPYGTSTPHMNWKGDGVSPEPKQAVRPSNAEPSHAFRLYETFCV